jgi:putative transposase
VGVTCAGERDILGLRTGDGGEGAKCRLSVLPEIKNRGTSDVCIVVCDGLEGLPEAVNTV